MSSPPPPPHSPSEVEHFNLWIPVSIVFGILFVCSVVQGFMVLNRHRNKKDEIVTATIVDSSEGGEVRDVASRPALNLRM